MKAVSCRRSSGGTTVVEDSLLNNAFACGPLTTQIPNYAAGAGCELKQRTCGISPAPKGSWRSPRGIRLP